MHILFLLVCYILKLYLFCRVSSSHRSFGNTFGLKRMLLNFDKDDRDSNNDVLYNFTDATSQLIRGVSVTPWKGPQKNINYSTKFDGCFVKSCRHCCRPHCIHWY